MTDNEIIKALECCLHRGCNECIRQPDEYGTNERQCSRGLMKCALNLINRQKAEKEALIAGQETLQKYIAEQKAEIDYWKRNAFDGCMERERIHKTAKAEAIKEIEQKSENTLIELYNKYHDIANRPKKETDMYYQGRAEAIWECISINRNLVKEMVGDDNE